MRHPFDPTSGHSIEGAHRVRFDMFRFLSLFPALVSVASPSLSAASDAVSPVSDDAISFTAGDDQIVFESDEPKAGADAPKKWSAGPDRTDATFEGWARNEILEAWHPRDGMVRQHSDFRTRVVLNVDSEGRVFSPVIVSTNASGDFHDSIQKAISSAVLRPPPKGEGQGIVIDFYADRAQ
jgi:hypothetical protein